jgi:hypothetical protein
MKRYMLFAGMQYHPLGGMADFQTSEDSIEELKRHIKWNNAPSEDYILIGVKGNDRFEKHAKDTGYVLDVIYFPNINFSTNKEEINNWYQIYDSQEDLIVEAYSSYELFTMKKISPILHPRDIFNKDKL